MNANITVKTKIRVNGREYASVEDMPADLRDAYGRALSAIGGGDTTRQFNIAGTPSSARGGLTTAIVFNGTDYASVEQMPDDVRRLYERVMTTLAAPAASARVGADGAPMPRQGDEGRFQVQVSGAQVPRMISGTVRPESTTPRLIIAALAIVALLLASFVFGR